MSKKREDSELEGRVDTGRRRLLGMAVYVPPIVIGAITLSQAGCQPDPSCSCAPNPAACITIPNSEPSQHDKNNSAGTDPTPEG